MYACNFARRTLWCTLLHCASLTNGGTVKRVQYNWVRVLTIVFSLQPNRSLSQKRATDLPTAQYAYNTFSAFTLLSFHYVPVDCSSVRRTTFWCFSFHILVHGQVTIIFVVSVGLSVCLSVCLCRVFISRLWSDFDQTWTYVICLGLVVSRRI